MANHNVEIKKLKMTKNVLRSIIELDKEFYKNFDYSDASWYLERYNEKNEVTVLVVSGKIIGYFLFLKISENLLFKICDLQYKGDFYFPTSELNVNSDIYYLASVLVKGDFREFSPVLLLALFRESQRLKTIVVITVSAEGKKMAEKFMTCVGNVKSGACVFIKTGDCQLRKRLLKHKKLEKFCKN